MHNNYGEQLHQIAGQDDNLTPEILLKAPHIKSIVFINNKKILRAVNLINYFSRYWRLGFSVFHLSQILKIMYINVYWKP